MREFAPPLFVDSSTPGGSVSAVLRERGFVVLPAEWAFRASGGSPEALLGLGAEWADMPADPYLKDGGHYRRRRHGSFVVEGEHCRPVPHRPHFQPVEYNALHGGMERWFEPMTTRIAASPAFLQLVVSLGALCSGAAGPRPWYVEAHQFRIDTHEGIGRPTPEGAHRDGVDFVAVVLVERARIKGGETRVFEAEAPHGLRFTLTDPWSLLFLDDARVIHESTPIQPVSQGDEARGHRDTLVVTFRKGAFQER